MRFARTGCGKWAERHRAVKCWRGPSSFIMSSVLTVCSRANVERYASEKSEGFDMKNNLMMPGALMILV